MIAQAFAADFAGVAIWATAAGACAGMFTGVIYAEVSSRVEDSQRGRALGWVMSGQSLTLVVGVPLAAAIGSMIGWRGWISASGACHRGRPVAGSTLTGGPGAAARAATARR